MVLKITYFSDNKVHRFIHKNVIHWYYEEGQLVIKFNNEDTLTVNNITLLKVEVW